jgi:hypothetical protein
MSGLNRSVRKLAYQAAALGVLAAVEGCSVHASWQAGSSSSGGEVRPERSPEQNDAEARARARKRHEQELARIDREARERVAQAERDAAEQERAAEAEAERQRQEAAAEAERKQKEEEEAAKKAALRRHGATAGGSFVNADGSPQSGAQSALDARRAEIEKAMADKKVSIRQKLEQNKADILVAAERKRNEVQASVKEEPAQSP